VGAKTVSLSINIDYEPSCPKLLFVNEIPSGGRVIVTTKDPADRRVVFDLENFAEFDENAGWGATSIRYQCVAPSEASAN
jgi:hypothetical protein